MTKETIIPIMVTILVAFSGYLAKYLNDLRIAQRKDRLERVNQQLRELYGPLFSLNKAGYITYEKFREKYCSRDDFQVEHPKVGGGSRRGIMPQSEETERIWRHWMKNVFMPLNTEMAQVIIDHSDLLEEEDMPECLLLLSAHVQGYKAILKAWEEKDYSEHMSLISFPAIELLQYTESIYRTLKARQAMLLGNRGFFGNIICFGALSSHRISRLFLKAWGVSLDSCMRRTMSIDDTDNWLQHHYMFPDKFNIDVFSEKDRANWKRLKNRLKKTDTIRVVVVPPEYTDHGFIVLRGHRILGIFPERVLQHSSKRMRQVPC